MATSDSKRDVDTIRKERKVTRALFTKNYNILEKSLETCTAKEINITIATQYYKVQELQQQLKELEREIRLYSHETDETNLEKEVEIAVEYQSKWLTLENKYKNIISAREMIREKRSFKLPTLQFNTFDGHLKNWIPFWGQFKKIDDDEQIDPQDKYQYLLQAMKEGSEPRNLVESFTPTAYKDCLSQLKARYAREELLIQVYVRELLAMTNKSDITNIVNLYDRLSAQLRALEILGVAKDKFAAFLLPMVESALPQNLLQVWERSKNLLANLDWNEIQRQSTIQRIKWKLNAPTAAWWGGFWERLIKILKDLLKRVLGKSSITYEELETILCDCEAVMNRRPLTYVESNESHSLEPLTPACFLQPIPQTDVADIDKIDTENLNRRLRYLQKLREDFRARFKTEYLTTLIQRGKEKKDGLKKGDIVLVETEEKRVKWPLGIIDEIFTGRDEIARTARVQTSTGYKVRPFQRLFKLEISEPDSELPGLDRTKVAETIPSTESESCPLPKITEVKSFVPADPDSPAETDLRKITRSGRVAKMPSRYLI